MVYRIILGSILLFSFSWGQNANRDSSRLDSQIIYGNDHSFFLTAPKGWVLDRSSGINQGLYVVFYPKRGGWKTSPAVMYAYTESKKSTNYATSENIIRSEVAQYKENYPKVKLSISPEIKTKDNKTALVRLYFYSHFESVAYIDEKPITVIIVLTAQTEKAFTEAFPSFQDLVRSYSFLTYEVENHK